jgi:hypothetical protein
MPIPHEDATIYIQGAIDSFGYIPNPKAIEAIRADIISNYSGHFTTVVLKESIGRHAGLMVRKVAGPVAPPPVAPPVRDTHVEDALKEVQAQFPEINLLNSNFNVALLAEHLDAFANSVVSPTTLRAAIRVLYERLEQYPPPPAEPEPEPPEILKTLADGSKQLSIRTTTEADLRDPSVTPLQLRDYLNRATGGAKPNTRF